MPNCPKYRIIKKAVGYNPIHDEYSFEYTPQVNVSEGPEAKWIAISFTNKVYDSKQNYPTLKKAREVIESYKTKVLIDTYPSEIIYVD